MHVELDGLSVGWRRFIWILISSLTCVPFLFTLPLPLLTSLRICTFLSFFLILAVYLSLHISVSDNDFDLPDSHGRLLCRWLEQGSLSQGASQSKAGTGGNPAAGSVIRQKKKKKKVLQFYLCQRNDHEVSFKVWLWNVNLSFWTFDQNEFKCGDSSFIIKYIILSYILYAQSFASLDLSFDILSLYILFCFDVCLCFSLCRLVSELVEVLHEYIWPWPINPAHVNTKQARITHTLPLNIRDQINYVKNIESACATVSRTAWNLGDQTANNCKYSQVATLA